MRGHAGGGGPKERGATQEAVPQRMRHHAGGGGPKGRVTTQEAVPHRMLGALSWGDDEAGRTEVWVRPASCYIGARVRRR